jgi:hypothetical protein
MGTEAAQKTTGKRPKTRFQFQAFNAAQMTIITTYPIFGLTTVFSPGSAPSQSKSGRESSPSLV